MFISSGTIRLKNAVIKKAFFRTYNFYRKKILVTNPAKV